MNNQKTFFYILFFLFFNRCLAQSFWEEYSGQYKRALGIKQYYVKKLINEDVEDPEFYLAIVFPELMRYAEKRDKLEVLLNSLTYTTISDYEGFSIGPFQMKPNFIKQLENYILSDSELLTKYSDLLIKDGLSEFSTKYERIIRLQSDKYTVRYLMVFIDISLKKYDLYKSPKNTQLRYLGAIYNSGFKDNLEDYQPYFSQKSFPYGINSKKSDWNYSDLVIDYYKNNKIN